MTILETERLRLRHFDAEDDRFMLELINEPAYHRFIGDRGVRTLPEAREFVLNGPVASYERHGFGLLVVELKATGEPLGICGLIKRESLDDVDIGFAFLARHWGRGFALESAAAVLKYGRDVVGLKRVVAITDPDNEASIKLLERIGLRFEAMIELPEYGASRLFSVDF